MNAKCYKMLSPYMATSKVAALLSSSLEDADKVLHKSQADPIFYAGVEAFQKEVAGIRLFRETRRKWVLRQMAKAAMSASYSYTFGLLTGYLMQVRYHL